MSGPTIHIDSYSDASESFHWAYMRHYVAWFTGRSTRHQRTEKVLKRLVKNGKLKSHLYGRKLIYTNKRPLSEVVHGLACTECLVRFYVSDRDCMVVPEKYFKGLGSIPEWGIIYPKGKMLLFEFCTKSNFLYTGNMRGKLAAYKSNLRRIEEKFQAKAVVVFVLDIERSAVSRYVGSVADGDQSALPEGESFPLNPFFFTDYETFLKVPFGKQLTEPIYIWHDGRSYPLRKYDGLETNH